MILVSKHMDIFILSFLILPEYQIYYFLTKNEFKNFYPTPWGGGYKNSGHLSQLQNMNFKTPKNKTKSKR